MESQHIKAAAKLLGQTLRRACGLAATFYTTVTSPEGAISYRGGYIARDGTWDYLDADMLLATPLEVRRFLETMLTDEDVKEDLAHAEHIDTEVRHDLALYTTGSLHLVSIAFFRGKGADLQLICGWEQQTPAAFIRQRLKEWALDPKAERPCLVYSWRHVCDLISQAEDKKYLSAPWKEITEETWTEMLNVLPPEKWQTVNGVNMFYVSEAQTSNIHSHYAKTQGRFFTKMARSNSSYSALSREVLTFCDENPRPAEEAVS